MPDPGTADAGTVMVTVAWPDRQITRTVALERGMTIAMAIERSGILPIVGNPSPRTLQVGIYGKIRTLDTLLRHRDRIEIYRALLADPMESRRRRAAHRAALEATKNRKA